MDIKAVLSAALLQRTVTSLSTVEELKERIARKRRHRHSTIGMLGVVVLALLLVLVLVPFSLSHRPPVRVGEGRAHAVTPTSSTASLIPVALPGPFTGYLASSGPLAIDPNGRVAYVGDPYTGLVTPIDLPSGRAHQPIELGRWGINAIAISPDGRTAYAVEGGIADAIIPIDLATRTAGPAIRVAGPRALGSSIAITPDGSMAYVDTLSEDQERPGTVTITNSTPSYVVPVDLTTKRALRPISLEPLSTGGHIVRSEEPQCLTNCAFDETIGGIAITANGRTAYVSESEPQSSGIFSIDLKTDRVGSHVDTGGAAGPIAIAPGAQTAYVAGNESVTSVDLSSNSVRRTFQVVSVGELFSSMAITPDGRTLVVAGYPEIGVIDLENGAVESPIHNPAGGADIAIAPPSKPAAVTTIPRTTTSTPHTGTIVVPNVMGVSLLDAVGELQAVGLTNSIDDLNCHGSLGPAHVIGQSPKAGFRAAADSRINLRVSCGNTSSTTP